MSMHGSLSYEAVRMIKDIKATVRYAVAAGDVPVYITKDFGSPLYDSKNIMQFKYCIVGHWMDDYSGFRYMYRSTSSKTFKRVIRYFERRKMFIPIDVNSEAIEIEMALGTFPENYLITHKVVVEKFK